MYERSDGTSINRERREMLELFEKLHPKDQLDRLIFLLEMPKEYHPPPYLNIAQRENHILDYYAGIPNGLQKLAEALRHLIEKQGDLGPNNSSAPVNKKEFIKIQLFLEGIDESDFDNEKRIALLTVISSIFSVKQSDIRILKIQSGSVQITIELPSEVLDKLKELSDADLSALMKIGVRSIQGEKFKPIDLRASQQITNDSYPEAFNKLIPLVYDELRRIARYKRRQFGLEVSFQTTDLVHEAVIALMRTENIQWQNMAHFYAIAATAIRRILIQNYRRRTAKKRGGKDALYSSSAENEASSNEQFIDLVALNEVLESLRKLDEQQARVIELRYFGGLKNEEIAEVLGISKTTIDRELRSAKAWLFAQLSSS